MCGLQGIHTHNIYTHPLSRKDSREEKSLSPASHRRGLEGEAGVVGCKEEAPGKRRDHLPGHNACLFPPIPHAHWCAIFGSSASVEPVVHQFIVASGFLRHPLLDTTIPLLLHLNNALPKHIRTNRVVILRL